MLESQESEQNIKAKESGENIRNWDNKRERCQDSNHNPQSSRGRHILEGWARQNLENCWQWRQNFSLLPSHWRISRRVSSLSRQTIQDVEEAYSGSHCKAAPCQMSTDKTFPSLAFQSLAGNSKAGSGIFWKADQGRTLEIVGGSCWTFTFQAPPKSFLGRRGFSSKETGWHWKAKHIVEFPFFQEFKPESDVPDVSDWKFP